MKKAQLLATLENSRDYTLKVAAAMPQEAYLSTPVSGSWNFGELLNHIAYSIGWWQENYVKSIESPWDPPETGNSKDEVMHRLEEAYASLNIVISGSDLSEAAIHGFYTTLDHITHHRGQAILYLRHKGIEPPEYSY